MGNTLKKSGAKGTAIWLFKGSKKEVCTVKWIGIHIASYNYGRNVI